MFKSSFTSFITIAAVTISTLTTFIAAETLQTDGKPYSLDTFAKLTSSMKNFPLDGQSSYKTEAVVFAPTDEA
jgi:hypothetical protein